MQGVTRMFFPFLVILPGLVAMTLTAAPGRFAAAPQAAPAHAVAGPVEGALRGAAVIPAEIDPATGRPALDAAGHPVLDYDLAAPNLLLRYFPTGLLGIGLTALLASFMSGMAGNVTAFNTVWTYDIYQAYIRRAEGLPAILAGMIGSTLGWREAPYLDCPAGPGDLARGLLRIEGEPAPVAIAPGLRCRRPDMDAPDVMRGEETQLMGWIAADRARAQGRALVCLPGTHANWAEVRQGRVVRFVTSMSGELFDLLSTHGVLRAPPAAPGEAADAAFDLGVEAAGDGEALVSKLFTARSRVVGGGALVVSPDTRPEVIRRTLERSMAPLPGFATATEAFAAYDTGARRLKLFPASTYGSAHLAALRAVLPVDAVVMAVGGVGPAAMADWWAAGVRGFGLGGDLYKPGFTPDDVRARAEAAVVAARALKA